MRQILVATDGSDSADHAVEYAASLAVGLSGKLHILNVAGDLSKETLEAVRWAPEIEKRIGDVIDAQSDRILSHAAELAKAKGVAHVDRHHCWGNAAEQILETIAKVRAETVVLGRRGRGQLTGLLLGSVSQKLASLAPVPVVIVP